MQSVDHHMGQEIETPPGVENINPQQLRVLIGIAHDEFRFILAPLSYQYYNGAQLE